MDRKEAIAGLPLGIFFRATVARSAVFPTHRKEHQSFMGNMIDIDVRCSTSDSVGRQGVQTMEKLSKNLVSATLIKIGTASLLVFAVAACPPWDPDRGTSSGSGSSSSGGGEDDDCFDYTSFDDTLPVSFKTDVMMILTNSCSKEGACHSLESGPEGQPYFGPASGTATSMDRGKILSQSKGIAAKKANMLLIDPEHPAKSFWMHKIDHTLGCPDVECAAGGCGEKMPKGAPMLEQKDRDTVRRWIAQGAEDN